MDEGLAWIKEHKEIRDVLITGGDPFILSDDKIEYLIRKLREIPLMPDYYIQGKTENEYTLRNHKGQTIKWPNIPE